MFTFFFFFNEAEAEFLAPWCLWWGRKVLSHPRAGFMRGLERISRRGWCEGEECHPAQKKKSTKGKREPARGLAPFHGQSLPSCSLKAPMRIPRHCFALCQGLWSPSACIAPKGTIFGIRKLEQGGRIL